MMYVKTPGKITIVLAAMALLFISLHFADVLPGMRGSLRPVVTGNLAFSESSNPSEKLRVAIYPGGGFAPGLLANGGLISSGAQPGEIKLDVEFILEDDPDASMRHLEDKNGAHLVWSTVPVFAYRYHKYRHLNPVAVMQYGWSRGEEVLYANETVSDISWLKGKTIACVEGGNAHLMILYLLDSNGIDKKDLKWRFTATDVDTLLLASKNHVSVVGISSSPEYVMPAGYHLVVSSAQIARLIPGIFLTREDILITHKEQIHAFVESWFKSATSLSSNTSELRDLITRSFQADVDKTEKFLGSFDLAGYRENLEFFGGGHTGFDYILDLSLLLWGNRDTTHPACESLKNTSILTSLNETFKKTGPLLTTIRPVFPKRPSLNRLTGELFVEFPSADYTPDYKTMKELRVIVRRAHVFTGSNLSVFGVTSSPDDLPHAYHWEMRFYNVSKMLRDLGYQNNVIRVPELSYDASLSGGGKHLLGFFASPGPD